MEEVDPEATEEQAASLQSVLIEGRFVKTTPAPSPRMPSLISGIAERGLVHIEQIPPERIAIDGIEFLLRELVEAVDDLSEAAKLNGDMSLVEKAERVVGFTGSIASLAGLGLY